MLSSAGVAFGLNVSGVFLIGTAGGLVLTLAGVFKVSIFAFCIELVPDHRQDILLISSGCLFFGSVITPSQIFGGRLFRS